MQRVNMFYGIQTPTAEQLGAGGLYFNTSNKNIYFSNDASNITIYQGTDSIKTQSAGSSTRPVYLSQGVVNACEYQLKSDVPANAEFTTSEAILNTTWNLLDDIQSLCSTSNGIYTCSVTSSSSIYDKVVELYNWMSYCYDNKVFGKWRTTTDTFLCESTIIGMDKTTSKTTSKPVVITTTVSVYLNFVETSSSSSGNPVVSYAKRINIKLVSTGTYTVNIYNINN